MEDVTDEMKLTNVRLQAHSQDEGLGGGGDGGEGEDGGGLVWARGCPDQLSSSIAIPNPNPIPNPIPTATALDGSKGSLSHAVEGEGAMGDGGDRAMPPFDASRFARTIGGDGGGRGEGGRGGRGGEEEPITIQEAMALHEELLEIRQAMNTLNIEWSVVQALYREEEEAGTGREGGRGKEEEAGTGREGGRGRGKEEEGDETVRSSSLDLEKRMILPIGRRLATLRRSYSLDCYDSRGQTVTAHPKVVQSISLCSRREAKELYLFLCSLLCCYLDILANSMVPATHPPS